MRSVENPFSNLVREICVKWGYCGSIRDGNLVHVTLIIPSSGEVDADQFVDWVMLADDVNPNDSSRHIDKIRSRIKEAFIRHMGSYKVDAKDLRYPD